VKSGKINLEIGQNMVHFRKNQRENRVEQSAVSIFSGLNSIYIDIVYL
jgi:hypothetical protein